MIKTGQIAGKEHVSVVHIMAWLAGFADLGDQGRAVILPEGGGRDFTSEQSGTSNRQANRDYSPKPTAVAIGPENDRREFSHNEATAGDYHPARARRGSMGPIPYSPSTRPKQAVTI
jgi:hypothetical protein